MLQREREEQTQVSLENALGLQHCSSSAASTPSWPEMVYLKHGCLSIATRGPSEPLGGSDDKILGACAQCRGAGSHEAHPGRREPEGKARSSCLQPRRAGEGSTTPGTWRQSYINTYQFSLRICRLSSAGTEQSYVSSSHLLPPCTASRGCSPAFRSERQAG